MQVNWVKQVPHDKQLVKNSEMLPHVNRGGRNYVLMGQFEKTFSRMQRVRIAIRALIKTIPLGIGLFFKSTREDWKAVFTGKKVVVYYQAESSTQSNLFKQATQSDKTSPIEGESEPKIDKNPSTSKVFKPKNKTTGTTQYLKGKKLYEKAQELVRQNVLVSKHQYHKAAELYEKAATYFQKAADLWHAEAQCALAGMYDVGFGVEKDTHRAFELYRQSAEQGHPDAQFALGLIYSRESDLYGMDQDWEKALEWYKLAADQGHGMASFAVGVCYEKGKGIKKDDRKAIEYYEKARDRGVEAAHYALDDMRESHQRFAEGGV